MTSLDSIIPQNINDDPSLLFHGTSNIYEEEIKSNGLRPNSSLFTKAELEKVQSVFDDLHWGGVHTEGYNVLTSYFLGHDFNQLEDKPIYLGESVQRVSLNASCELAGGEICRALHYCFKDLHSYLNNVDICENHHNQISSYPGIHRIPIDTLPSLEWLENTLNELDGLEKKLTKCGISLNTD